MPRFVIFLDVDGVLHPITWAIPGGSAADQSRLSLDEYGLLVGVRGLYAVPQGDPFSRLPTLEAVLRPFLTRTSIVISSTWRRDCEKYATLVRAFSPDVRARIVGVTPTGVPGGRPMEIASWLDEHDDPDALPIVIDDDSSQRWWMIADRAVGIRPGQAAFSGDEAALLRALLALPPDGVHWLKATLARFNSMPAEEKRMTLENLNTGTSPCFGDFEASSLEPDSYPIEVAWSLPSGEVRSYLIKPDPDWGDDWDELAELEIHGISREELDAEGVDPFTIARAMNRDLAGQVLHFDGGGFDRAWLQKLFDAAGLEMTFAFGDFDALLADVPANRRVVAEARARADTSDVPRHRAGNDVRFLQRWYAHARDHEPAAS